MTKLALLLSLIIPCLASADFENKIKLSCDYSLQIPNFVPTNFELGYLSDADSDPRQIALLYQTRDGKERIETHGSRRSHSILIENSADIEEAGVYSTIFDLDSLNDLLSGGYSAIVAAGSYADVNGNYGTYHAYCYTR